MSMTWRLYAMRAVKPVVTFTPLSRGRYRANGKTRPDGKPVILKKNQLDAYRQNEFNRKHPRRVQRREKTIDAPAVTLSRWLNHFECPRCGNGHRHEGGSGVFDFRCGKVRINRGDTGL